MANRKQAEKQMLLTANKLRKLVYADFTVNAVHPAAMALIRALAPKLKALGPKALAIAGKIPAETWAQIIPAVIQTLAPQQPRKATADFIGESAVDLERAFKKAGVSNSDVISRALLLAAIETRTAHRKKKNPKVIEAIRLANNLQQELKTLKEFA
jgi:hypothetical protein